MGNPVIEDLVLWSVRSWLLERSDTPGLYRICGVGPYPFSRSDKLLPLNNSMRVLKGGGVMYAATVSNNVVDYAEVGERDKLPVQL